MKKNILFFVLGLVIAGSIGAYAIIQVSADKIGYKDGTVEDALNYLYGNVISKNMVTDEVYAGHNISSGTTLTNVGSYKAYYVVIEESDSSYSGMDHFKQLLNLSSTNSSLIELGNAWRNKSGTYRFAIGYMIFPDGSGQDIVITHNAVDCMSVYGIRESSSND